MGALGAGLAVPAPIVGLGLITLWNRDPWSGIYQSYAVVLLAFLARFLPIAIFLCKACSREFPRNWKMQRLSQVGARWNDSLR